MDDRSEREDQRAARSIAFNAWFGRMCAYFHRKNVEEIRAVYAKALAHVPVADLETIFHAIISRADAPKRDLPRIDVLLRRWEDYRERTEPRRPVDSDDEFERQRRILTPLVRRALNEGMLARDSGPEWAVTIASYVGQRFRAEHPLPGAADDVATVAPYFELANRLFRDEVAKDYRLAPSAA